MPALVPLKDASWHQPLNILTVKSTRVSLRISFYLSNRILVMYILSRCYSHLHSVGGAGYFVNNANVVCNRK